MRVVNKTTRHFYPRPPRGGRPLCAALRRKSAPNFYPRPPRGGRLGHTLDHLHTALFLSTPSARRATRDKVTGQLAQDISIHALREEGDAARSRWRTETFYFYPRPPRGGRRFHHRAGQNLLHISIHALREEGDLTTAQMTADVVRFLSTPSARRATRNPGGQVPGEQISIHALREEGDSASRFSSSVAPYFYPRPPRGGRQYRRSVASQVETFLSTPSARRATFPSL